MRRQLTVFSTGIFAGMLAGIFPGLVARLAMRVVALAIGRGTGFTLGGTFGVIVGPSMIFGALMGLLYLGIRDNLGATARLQRGLLYGVLIFLLFGAPFFLLQAEFIRDIRLSPVLGRLLFYLTPLLYSVPLAYLVPWLESRWSVSEGRVTVPEVARYALSVVVFVSSVVLLAAFINAILPAAVNVIGLPMRRIVTGHSLRMSLQLVVGAVLLLAYPAFVLLTLYLALRQYLFGANWMRGLLLGLAVVVVVDIIALLSISAQSNSELVQRAPLAGLAVLSVLLVFYAAVIHIIQPHPTQDAAVQAPALSSASKVIVGIVIVAEAMLLIASAISG